MISIFGKLRTKKAGSFQKRNVSFFLQSPKGGLTPDPPLLAYVTGTHIHDLAPGEHNNVAAVASRWRHSADLTGPGFEPMTFRADSDV